MKQNHHSKKVLLVYIEPTPYITELIKHIISTFSGNVDVLFLNENVSQHWNLNLEKNWLLFPTGKLNRLNFIIKKIKKNKYDLVHIAGWSEPVFLFLLFFSKMCRIPVSIESDTPMPQYTPLWKRLVKRMVYPYLFKRVNLFLPGGTKQAKYLEHFGVPLSKITHAKMTVDVSNFSKYAGRLNREDWIRIRQRYQISENDIVYLYVGRLETHKGIMDLISAFNLIKNDSIILLFVGDGSLRHSIETEMKIKNQIRYAGRLSSEALIDTYYAADVVVLPSHFEPWGLVINEAMAVGKPVIVSDRVGCIDDLVTCDTGIITRAENIEDLRYSLEWMSTSVDRREQMGKKAKQIISHWTLENEAENICKAWSKLISLS